MARRLWADSAQETGTGDEEVDQPADTTNRCGTVPALDTHTPTSDREELIQRIKRGEKPTWVPKPSLQALSSSLHQSESIHGSPPSGILDHLAPLARTDEDTVTGITQTQSQDVSDPIERPRSALHAGDFREGNLYDQASFSPPSSNIKCESNPCHPLGSSPPPWLSSTPYRSSNVFRTNQVNKADHVEISGRNRAPSLGSSLSSNFFLRVPTSPLVHAFNNTSVDDSLKGSSSPPVWSPERGTDRRRTLPPEAFQSLRSGPAEQPINFSRPLSSPYARLEYSLPFITHQSQKSQNSFTYQSLSSPQSPPPLRSRRTSFAFESSPIQHAAMVGSFEESILRGRMSTAPSKPLDFVAQIGVMGKGDCKPSLKCPAHVTVPFPAVFYNYPSLKGSRSPADDSPSPYVGTIDLESNLDPIGQSQPQKSRLSFDEGPEQRMANLAGPENTAIGRALARKAKEQKRRSSSPKAPLGGCYRVPQRGQLQLIIKNPNKTAVKLFLVPYDLEGMQPGMRTFVRQRSFSAGPIIEAPLGAGAHAATKQDPLKDKHVLRYLVHLKFCCLSRGRFYLYDNIRVVFANRVPDGKEKLRNEVQVPEPKYTNYKPCTDATIGAAGAKLAAEKAFKRRSSGFSMASQLYDAIDGFTLDGPRTEGTVPPVPTIAIPFHLNPQPKAVLATTAPSHNHLDHSAEHAREVSKTPAVQTQHPTSGFDTVSSTISGRITGIPVPISPASWSHVSRSSSIRSFSPTPPEAGDGLLSRKLREYEASVRSQQSGTDTDVREYQQDES